MLIKKYNIEWAKNFQEIKREIEKGLHGLEHRSEHIGSTSVPNLDSKDIIDIDIIHQRESEFPKIKIALIEIGYFHNGNQGIEKREVFKRTGKHNHRVLDTIRHHLYVCPDDSQALEQHILFRNFLRENEWARLKYQEMKYECASMANQDKKLYAELKERHVNSFIESIVEQEKQKHHKS